MSDPASGPGSLGSLADVQRSLRRSKMSDAADRLRAAGRRPTAPTASEELTQVLPPPLPDRAGYLGVKGMLQERLLREIGTRNLFGMADSEVVTAVQDFTQRVLDTEDLPLNEHERSRLAEELIEETTGLGPLAPLMADPAITDILVNGPKQVWVERFGRLERTDVRFRDQDQIVRVIERIASIVGRRIDTASPMADLRLADGSRVNATLPPVTIDGPTISIRRFGRKRLRRDDLLKLGMMSREMLAFLDVSVRHRINILISGGTGAGKSTLLGAMAETIPQNERIITIEDTAELILDQEHVVRMETRPANVEGRGLIAARDLVINALRMRPDRIVVGEVRGGEALDMLQAMNTGHDGSMTTIHSNSPRDALSRLETMVLMAGLDLPSRAIREQVTSAIQLLVHVRRFEDGVRRIETISEMTGMEGNTPLLQDVFFYRRRGKQGKHLVGEFAAAGIVPHFVEELRHRGIEISLDWFKRTADGLA
jgi:pilus assembly protein CpaF